MSRDRVLRPLFQHACIKDGKLAAFKVSAELLTSMSWQLFASDRTRPAWMAENIKSQRVSQLIANWKKSHLSLHGTFFLSWKSTDINELCKESYYYYYYYAGTGLCPTRHLNCTARMASVYRPIHSWRRGGLWRMTWNYHRTPVWLAMASGVEKAKKLAGKS